MMGWDRSCDTVDEAVMAETKSKKKIDSKMLKNILSMKQDELSNAAAEYQELREKAVRLNILLFEPSWNNLTIFQTQWIHGSFQSIKSFQLNN